MKKWTWAAQKINPEAMLDAAETISTDNSWFEAYLDADWCGATSYLSWASQAFEMENDFGWDATVCYAKRAVCRAIDGFMISNHCGNFLHKTYPDKLAIVNEIGVEVPDVVHDLIIDPRNEIEHSYEVATKQNARHAVQIARMFLKTVEADSRRGAIISLGKHLSSRSEISHKPGEEREIYEFELREDASPMLFIDCRSYETHQVLLLRPKDSELLHCPIVDFKIETLKPFVKVLRKQYAGPNHAHSELFTSKMLSALRNDLGIASLKL